jgi:hypothetical protein
MKQPWLVLDCCATENNDCDRSRDICRTCNFTDVTLRLRVFPEFLQEPATPAQTCIYVYTRHSECFNILLGHLTLDYEDDKFV